MTSSVDSSDIRISAIIPVYNRSNTIARAIESVLDQYFPAEEVIVIDDGSTDESARIIKSFGDKVIYLYQTNAGASAARNLGVQKASCPWIAFLDSDDYWTPNHLRNIEMAIKATYGKAKLYFSDTQRAGDEESAMLWPKCGFEVASQHQLTSDGGDWVMINRQPMMLQSSVFNRDAYLQVGGLKPELKSREDTHMFFRICFHNSVCAVNHCGTVMSCDAAEDRLTRIYGSEGIDYWQDTEVLYRDILETMPELPGRHVRALRYRLASAYMVLGHLARKEGDKKKALQFYLKAAMTSRQRFIEAMLRALVRGTGKRG